MTFMDVWDELVEIGMGGEYPSIASTNPADTLHICQTNPMQESFVTSCITVLRNLVKWSKTKLKFKKQSILSLLLRGARLEYSSGTKENISFVMSLKNYWKEQSCQFIPNT